MNVYNVKHVKIYSGSNWTFTFYREVICYLYVEPDYNSCSYLMFSGANKDCTWLISADELPERLPSYNSNVQEADNRIWRHTTLAEAIKIQLIMYSPDTAAGVCNYNYYRIEHT